MERGSEDGANPQDTPLMGEQECHEYFVKNLQPNVIGSVEQALTKFQYAVFIDKVNPDIIVTKWNEYIMMCRKQETKSQYIKHTANWLTQKGYNDNILTKDMKTRGFLDRWLSGLKYLFA